MVKFQKAILKVKLYVKIEQPDILNVKCFHKILIFSVVTKVRLNISLNLSCAVIFFFHAVSAGRVKLKECYIQMYILFCFLFLFSSPSTFSFNRSNASSVENSLLKYPSFISLAFVTGFLDIKKVLPSLARTLLTLLNEIDKILQT